MIVLSKLDDRYYRDLRGRANWTMDFGLVREGEKTPISSSNHSFLFRRSVNLEATLEAGTYLVYVRLDRTLSKYRVSRFLNGKFVASLYLGLQGTKEDMIDDDELRKLSRIMAERANSKSIVASELPSYLAIHTQLMGFG